MDKFPMTIKLAGRVHSNLDWLSQELAGRQGMSLKRWIGDVALPRFVRYERRRVKRRKAQIEREVAELERRARARADIRKLESEEVKEGLALLGKLQSRGEDLSEDERAKVAETMAHFLARRTMLRAHARALEEDEIRESVKLADRLRKREDLSYELWERIEQILRGENQE